MCELRQLEKLVLLMVDGLLWNTETDAVLCISLFVCVVTIV